MGDIDASKIKVRLKMELLDTTEGKERIVASAITEARQLAEEDWETVDELIQWLKEMARLTFAPPAKRRRKKK